jgi:hypothetical protein
MCVTDFQLSAQMLEDSRKELISRVAKQVCLSDITSDLELEGDRSTLGWESGCSDRFSWIISVT